MSLDDETFTKKQRANAKKIVRRQSTDEDPVIAREVFPGDVVEIPFLGACEVGFRLGHETRTPIYVRKVVGNPPRFLFRVPDWVPVRCVTRYRKNETG